MTKETARRSLWQLPLLHFLVAGAAVFVISEWRAGNAAPPAEPQITITVAEVERMAAQWTRTWGRPPGEGELQGLVRDHIKEEIYYREALRLGLDLDDTVIRRRLRQKMEFLSEGDSPIVEPDDRTLKAYYVENADRYQNAKTIDFRQIYFGESNTDRVNNALAALREGASPASLGDSVSLPQEMTAADERAIERIFGAAFFDDIKELPTNVWAGPIHSSYGQHLINITKRDSGTPATLAENRRRVIADWRTDEILNARDAAFEALRENYKVTVEQPD